MTTQLNTGLVSPSSALLMTTQQRMHRKKVAHRLPLQFPDYDALLVSTGNNFIYPQSFAFDDVSNEVFVLYCGDIGTTQWVAVFDRKTSAYKSCFGIGTTRVSEGLDVVYEGASRFIYSRHSGAGLLGKYDITALPATRSVVAPTSTYDVGLNLEFAYRNGIWLVEQDAPPVGYNKSRTVFTAYNSAFGRMGSLVFDKIDMGFTTQADSSYANYIPKRQGIALGDGYVATAHGGYIGETDAVNFYAYQGVKVYNLAGQRVAESILNPLKMMAVMELNGIGCTRIENEGVIIDAKGRVYSMFVHRGRFGEDVAAAKVDGVVIFEEFSADDTAIDFTSAVASYPTFSVAQYEQGVFPRSSDGKIIDPLKGTEITTINALLDFMSDLDLKQTSFYTNSVALLDVTGVALPDTTFVNIKNANNNTFWMTLLGDGTATTYQLFGTSGARSQVQMRERGLVSEMVMASTIADATDKLNRIRSKHYTNAEKDFLGIDIQSTSASNNVMIGGGSSLYNAATTIRFFTAATNATVAGTERMRIDNGVGVILKPLASSTPVTNGDMSFQATSNTSITLKYKGTDGVVRSVALTLA